MVTAILTIIVLHMDPMLGVEKLFLKDILINKHQIFQKEKKNHRFLKEGKNKNKTKKKNLLKSHG